MELHLVHRNSRYADLKSAVAEPDGLAVFAFLFEVDRYGDKDNWRRGFRPHPHLPSVTDRCFICPSHH